MKRTPLYDEHVALGGKMVSFAGWQMPVQYKGIIAEHTAVRERVGVFDVSHMGEIWVTGEDAERCLQYLTCNDVARLRDGMAQYSALLNDYGGVIDDLIVYRFASDRYLLCVNASNTDEAFEWIVKRNPTDSVIKNASEEFGQIAVQGPQALSLLKDMAPEAFVSGVKRFGFVEVRLEGIPTIIARTGYTGEDGVEIFLPAKDTSTLWKRLLETGAVYGIEPCGLGARDSLRLEAAYPLHGHELSRDVSVLESGLSWIVRIAKGDFIGRGALCASRDQGMKNSLVGFFLDEPGIARQGDVVRTKGGEVVGVVTSGTKTPTIQRALGMARVSVEHADAGTPLVFVVRNREIAGHVVPLPFYKGLFA
jgi:aminomethyltransferase